MKTIHISKLTRPVERGNFASLAIFYRLSTDHNRHKYNVFTKLHLGDVDVCNSGEKGKLFRPTNVSLSICSPINYPMHACIHPYIQPASRAYSLQLIHIPDRSLVRPFFLQSFWNTLSHMFTFATYNSRYVPVPRPACIQLGMPVLARGGCTACD